MRPEVLSGQFQGSFRSVIVTSPEKNLKRNEVVPDCVYLNGVRSMAYGNMCWQGFVQIVSVFSVSLLLVRAHLLPSVLGVCDSNFGFFLEVL